MDLVRAEVWLGASTSSTDMVEAYLVLYVFVSVVRVNNHTVHPQINGFFTEVLINRSEIKKDTTETENETFYFKVK